MKKDFSQQIKDDFDVRFCAALKKAKRKADLFIENLQLDDLEIEEQLLLIQLENQLIEEEIESASNVFEMKVDLRMDDEYIYQVLRTQMLFYGINEEDKKIKNSL